MNIIETHELTKYYGKARGIIDLNLAVEEGDLFGFIGPNGAGKSTTIRLLLGLIHKTSGDAKIFGQRIGKQQKEILSQLGYMPSESQFYGQMTVEEVILLAAHLHHKDCSKEANLLIERFQLDRRKKIEDLSLGNRKKVSIICALQHNPRLAILDEPTSGLDPLMQKEFFDVLEEQNKKGSTIFFSSHVLPEIQNHCKNAAIIREGKLIKTDSVVNLTATSAKVVTLTEAEGVNDIRQLSNVSDLKEVGTQVSFLYKGQSKELIELISQMKFKDVTIAEPSLEEIFMHFYEKEGK